MQKNLPSSPAETQSNAGHFAVCKGYSSRRSTSSRLLSTDGTTLLTDKDKIPERWAEHFSAVPKQPSSMDEKAIVRLPRTELNHTFAVPLPLEETQKAINLFNLTKLQGSMPFQKKKYKGLV